MNLKLKSSQIQQVKSPNSLSDLLVELAKSSCEHQYHTDLTAVFFSNSVCR